MYSFRHARRHAVKVADTDIADDDVTWRVAVGPVYGKSRPCSTRSDAVEALRNAVLSADRR